MPTKLKKKTFIRICPNCGSKKTYIQKRSFDVANKTTNCVKCLFRNIEDAQRFTSLLGLKSQKEWVNYCKSGNKPKDIPSSIHSAYNGEITKRGGFGWWLGTGKIADQNREFISYERLQKLIIRLGIKNHPQYDKWWKKHRRIDIPQNPARRYDEFKSWPNFTDTEYYTQNELKEIIFNSQNPPKTSREYEEWVKKQNNPKIPLIPHRHYGDDFQFGELLGTGNLEPKQMTFLPFEEAHEIVKKENLKDEIDWRNYCANKKPNNIPSAPRDHYPTKWMGMLHWLGNIGKGTNAWSNYSLIHFISSLQNELVNLNSIELITIINSNNLAQRLNKMGKLNNLITARAGSQERQEIVNDILNIVEGITEEDNNDVEGNTSINTVQDILTEEQINNVITTQDNEDETPRINVVEELRVYDNDMLTSSLDDENVDFLLKNGLKKVWINVLKDNFDIESYRNEIGGDNFNIIKGWFFDEYDEAISLQIPNDLNRNYIPNLMQRLVTIRNIREKSYGNWSDTGTGKTLASLITGRVANAKNVLIICNNSTVDGWVKSIKDYFPNSNTYTKKTVTDKYDFQIIDGEWNYLIFNYETFQQKDGEYMAYQIANNNRIDYCILDEIHNIKQREVETESIRRSVVVKLVTTLREKNENFMLTGMSATPIINNFQEPKAIIELLTGKVHKEIDVTENVQNGIELYKLLTRYGLRYKGKKITRVNLDVRRINGNHLFENINQLSSNDLLGTELLLLQDKLESVRDVITDGKMIFVNNVGRGILKRIGDFVSGLGLTYGFCTGDDKEGLDKFKRGEINVLIGSTPITTGVDGLQHRCNGIIKLILPWTNAEDKQLDGRVIDRTGCIFDEVDIIIPQVYVEDESGNVIWDWDKWRYDRVKFKKTLMDLVLDGEVPEGKLPSKQKLLQDALAQLDIWKKRIENGEILTTQREELKVPLSGEYSGQLQRRLGDFSEMNRVWSISNSKTTSQRLLESPEEWYQYHTLYSEKRKEWNEIPYKVIGKKISSRPDWIVGDFGCGENLLSKEINNQVYAFDHIAIDDDVIACDISDVSEYLNDNVLDVVVNSLSLMGSNYVDYLKEEHRTLKPYGIIMICEPKSKWEGRENELISVLEEIGFNCRIVRTTDKFIYIDGNKI